MVMLRGLIFDIVCLSVSKSSTVLRARLGIMGLIYRKNLLKLPDGKNGSTMEPVSPLPSGARSQWRPDSSGFLVMSRELDDMAYKSPFQLKNYNVN